jgi:hypothetical protein
LLLALFPSRTMITEILFLKQNPLSLMQAARLNEPRVLSARTTCSLAPPMTLLSVLSC